ncbi:MAG: amidohydrolase family protein, partial [Kordiimonas sp.]
SITASKGFNDGNKEAFRKSTATADALVKKLHDSGITILPGTDAAFPGFALISELEMYVGAGISVKDVLKLATIGSAKHIGQGEALGTVEVGKKAHLILVDGDPTENITNLRNLSLVIKGQTYFKPKEMLKAQGYKPYAETIPMR